MRAENENWGDSVRQGLFDERRALVVHWLVLINALVFLAGFFFQMEVPRELYPPGEIDLIQVYGAYSEFLCFREGEFWRLLTYQFLHANLGHILFNMVALWFFGPVVEERFGHVRFLLYYLSCGVAAALFSSLLGALGLFDAEWSYVPMVGASGSIYGVMAACAVLFPHARVQLLFPPIDLSVRQFAIAVLGIACAVIVFQWNNAGGEAGHLGGMFAGFVLTLLILFKERLDRTRRRSFASTGTARPRPSAPARKDPPPAAEEVNAVMDKISRSGLSSLTEEEREILQRASRR